MKTLALLSLGLSLVGSLFLSAGALGIQRLGEVRNFLIPGLMQRILACWKKIDDEEPDPPMIIKGPMCYIPVYAQLALTMWVSQYFGALVLPRPLIMAGSFIAVAFLLPTTGLGICWLCGHSMRRETKGSELAGWIVLIQHVWITAPGWVLVHLVEFSMKLYVRAMTPLLLASSERFLALTGALMLLAAFFLQTYCLFHF